MEKINDYMEEINDNYDFDYDFMVYYLLLLYI